MGTVTITGVLLACARTSLAQGACGSTIGVLRVANAGYAVANGDYVLSAAVYVYPGNNLTYRMWHKGTTCSVRFSNYDASPGHGDTYTGWGIGCLGHHRYAASPGWSGGSVSSCFDTNPVACLYGPRLTDASYPVPTMTFNGTCGPTTAPTAMPTIPPTDVLTIPPTAAPTITPTHIPTGAPNQTAAPNAASTPTLRGDAVWDRRGRPPPPSVLPS